MPGETVEAARLAAEARLDTGANWKRWGTYLAERQWGTVREDFSTNAFPWGYFTHDDAVWRAYRWGEDGLLGWSDRQGRLCFSIALWNGVDPILKERLYGVTGPEGNHGEDVKEAYFYLDATPTHSYCKGLYKYPQQAYPYEALRSANGQRGRHDLEFELTDTGIFDDNRYFDVFIEYAKASPDDMAIRITVHNRADKAATLHLLPTLWFRNHWAWKSGFEKDIPKPKIKASGTDEVTAAHQTLGKYVLRADKGPDGKSPKWLFTENETNLLRSQRKEGSSPSCKDAFHQYLIQRRTTIVNPRLEGTKAAAVYALNVPAKGSAEVRLRLTDAGLKTPTPFGKGFEQVFSDRITEADSYYESLVSPGLSEDEKRVLRQANAGLLWTKQFYYYAVDDWVKEAPERVHAHEWVERTRNHDWSHLFNRDVLSMPDKWEYPWYAAWDSAFHMIPFANLDPYFAKEQLILLLREWYMHPNGQIPAYEWNFSDVNPPVHAWSCWRVYQMTAQKGQRDREFLARCFQKLLLNFTWWVNRKDVRGRHVFTGGFLGLDNIGIFDRSKPIPTGGHLEQADGTAWMAYYCSSMLSIAFELADGNPAYEDMASKFFEHYMNIAAAMNSLDGSGLWDEQDGFYYDHLHIDGKSIPLRIRSIVGIVPLFTVDILYDRVVDKLPAFQKRMRWFLDHRKEVIDTMTYMEKQGPETEQAGAGLRLLAIPTREQLERILRYVLDEDEFLSPFGIRSLSKYHEKNPFVFHVNGSELKVQYVPGESDSGMFGGNSNWRGPVWFPLNYILIEAFERYHQFYGDDLRVECPTGSGCFMNLREVANELRARLTKLFLLTDEGKRPCYSRGNRFIDDPNWENLVLFYEYFHGDTGRGLGASHQTGWTALIAPIIEQLAANRIPCIDEAPVG
ncbi:MGH1-like glycoside hydrolase domain-containing protein [Planctomyces sp. SH-PL14]|uniref:MGH1-like glycoside hydrolase domain-containing protein n=1 Tax=Planctomyces sp. SH-PL14 TaxID=1632864 RepID=UPI00078DCE73|nr:glucosidase [Planctomyces sp. SH-PL14]AMV17559.1 Mannosyl oligosaccharide glucosidase [Planctomyces sp. SH-PL14]